MMSECSISCGILNLSSKGICNGEQNVVDDFILPPIKREPMDEEDESNKENIYPNFYFRFIKQEHSISSRDFGEPVLICNEFSTPLKEPGPGAIILDGEDDQEEDKSDTDPDALFGCSTTTVFTVLPDSLSDYNADFHSDPTESDPLYICEESSSVAEIKEKGGSKENNGSGEKFYGFSFVGSTAGSSASALGREREKLLGKLKVKTEMCNSFDGYEGVNEKPNNNGKWSSRMRRGKGKFRSTECPVWECSRRFFRSCDLRRHLLLECGKLATYSCNHCPRKFYRNKDLNKHYASLNMDAIKLESVHNIELPINDCDRKNHRDKHIDSASRKVEEGRKRKRSQNKAVNTCAKCCKTFKRYGNLRLHVIYQCGKKPRYRCSVCAKLFHFKSGMERHFSACHGKRSIRTEWPAPDADLPEKSLVE